MSYVRDMSDAGERRHVQRWFFPAQLVRGLLFFYTHIACAAPCSDNIEGLVYMKARYFDTTAFFKYQLEMLMYSVLFAAGGAWLLV